MQRARVGGCPPDTSGVRRPPLSPAPAAPTYALNAPARPTLGRESRCTGAAVASGTVDRNHQELPTETPEPTRLSPFPIVVHCFPPGDNGGE